MAGLAIGAMTACKPQEDTGLDVLVEESRPVSTPVASLTLANPSRFERADEGVKISFSKLGINPESIGNLRVLEGGNELPSQLIDTDGDGEHDALMFLADFAPAETRFIEIVNSGTAGQEPPARTRAEISIKQGGHWEGQKYMGGTFVNVESLVTPPQYTDHSEFIRYEGPGIESELVGYRVYLDWRNGFDIFGKRIHDLVLQDVGQDGYDSYHEPADWGMDVLKVGEALGMGGYGFWDGQQVVRVSEVAERSVEVLHDGPVYSKLGINYQGWQIDDQVVDLGVQLSMAAGSRLVHVEIDVSESLPNIAAGIVKHPDTVLLQGDLEISGHAWTYVASWGRQSLSEDHLGMMLLYRQRMRDEQTEDEHNYVSVLTPANGRLEYYFGAIWEQEPGGISTEAEFVELLEMEAEKLTMPLRVQLETEHSVREKAAGIDSDTALGWSARVAESTYKRVGESLFFEGFDGAADRSARWSYTTGLLMQALDDVSLVTGEQKYSDLARRTMDSYLTEDGGIRTYNLDDYNIDNINSGKLLLRLYERHGDEKYRTAADLLRAQLRDHPRTSEGAFWHKQRYPFQLWLDGVYMGMPFLAHHAILSGEEAGLEEAIHEFTLVRKHLLDPAAGLYFHAWDEKKQQVWADPETGLSRYFWSRGMGWYAMALVDILDYVPQEREDLRDPIIATIREFADTLLSYQAADGGWYQIVDMPDETGNYLESSGSSMFIYMLAKAVNQGYLDESYRDIAAKAYERLVRRFINVETDGTVNLTSVCQVAGLGYGRDGSYGYYMSEPVVSNDPKGVGPFIMAGLEISRMLKDDSGGDRVSH
jgi:rhamnogalacturonyl hydrolase YesR